VPNLHGKKDLIPTHVTTTWLQADRPGVFRGQCAEFCGLQHAHMALDLVAEPEAQFGAWLAGQARPAPPPADPRADRGLAVFLAAPCVGCHTVRGTPALGRLGPDLTHVASRQSLAAGTRANTPEHLAAWIADPQHVKPGALMPPAGLPPDDLRALVAFLEGLR
jgi:cytochrome c oxidase subunit 2